jgi:CheY-like chemotaxis protein
MRKILVIEDDNTIAMMYYLEMEEEGYTTVIADTGVQGIAVVKKEKPAIILLDIQMPVMDGVEALRRIRQLPNGKDVPVLVLTNIGKDERLKDFADLNISGYIVKSDSTPRQVREAILSVLSQSRRSKK